MAKVSSQKIPPPPPLPPTDDIKKSTLKYNTSVRKVQKSDINKSPSKQFRSISLEDGSLRKRPHIQDIIQNMQSQLEKVGQANQSSLPQSLKRTSTISPAKSNLVNQKQVSDHAEALQNISNLSGVKNGGWLSGYSSAGPQYNPAFGNVPANGSAKIKSPVPLRVFPAGPIMESQNSLESSDSSYGLPYQNSTGPRLSESSVVSADSIVSGRHADKSIMKMAPPPPPPVNSKAYKSVESSELTDDMYAISMDQITRHRSTDIVQESSEEADLRRILQNERQIHKDIPTLSVIPFKPFNHSSGNLLLSSAFAPGEAESTESQETSLLKRTKTIFVGQKEKKSLSPLEDAQRKLKSLGKMWIEIEGCIAKSEYGFVLKGYRHEGNKKKADPVYIKMVSKKSEAYKAVGKYVNPENTELTLMQSRKAKHLPAYIDHYWDDDYLIIITKQHGIKKLNLWNPFKDSYCEVQWIYYFNQAA